MAIAVWGPGLLLRAGGRGARPAPPAERPLAPVVEPNAEVLPVFAEADAVLLRIVSPDTLAIAFHEASRRGATAMQPLGVCALCRNRGKFHPPPGGSPELPYIVMDSRGRRFPATSAVDLVLPEATPVLSPVNGVVTDVKRYRLYRRYPDVRVAIVPDGRADRTVVLIHLAGVKLRVGDRVEASVSEIGRVRHFPFESHVERYVKGHHPHVHIEVKHGSAARGIED